MDEYDIGKAFKRIEDELIRSMIRNFEHHKAEETKEGFQWTQWQVEQLRALEEYKKQNKEKFNGDFAEINKSIGPLIKMARKEGNLEQEEKILKAIKNGAKLQKGKGDVIGAFFQVNDRKLNALVKATTDDFKKAEVAILRMADDQYRKTIFAAQVYANAGGTNYEKAVDMATKDFISKGINCIEYKDGSRHRLEDYASMAIRTAVKRAYLTGEGEKRKEWGISTVIMNKRGNACPKCLPFVGKILIDDVWSGGSKEDGTYPLMSEAISAGLYHPNCKDSHTTYFPGISTPPNDKYSRKELQEIHEQYKKEAKEKYAKRQQGKFKRLGKNSLDEENKKYYKSKANEWAKYSGNGVENISNSGIMNVKETFRKPKNARDGVKFISDEMFDKLTIAAKKKGAVIIRGTEEAERHLDAVNAAASNIGDILMFRKDVCISEVLEETYHFEQNIQHLNDEKGEPLRSILNEIDAKQYLLENAAKYKIPRNELELTKKQLEDYKKQLKEYEERRKDHV